MTCGERVKEIRKAKHMTLEKFGKALGVTKTSISRLENGINSVTDQMVKSICREFGVSEPWLRTGVGDMFTPITTDEKYKKAADAIAGGTSDLDRIIRQTLIYYYEMDNSGKSALLDYVKNIAALLPGEKDMHAEAPTQEELNSKIVLDTSKNVG